MPSADPTTASSNLSKPFSISFGSKKPKSTEATASKKRPHSALAEPDSDHEVDSSGPQLVSAFDQSGAIFTNGISDSKAPLVIPAEKNRDWREESRKKRRKNLLPAEVQAAQKVSGNDDGKTAHIERDEVSKVSGIQFINRDQDGDSTMAEEAVPQNPALPDHVVKSADEEAMESLLGARKTSTLQIPMSEANNPNDYDPSDPSLSDYANEDERFRADLSSRPEVPSLDDYTAVPVEGFGPALLRGMGWKDGEAVGKRRAESSTPKAIVVKERRPALLGIGAKETPGGVGDEFGTWGKAAKGKRKTDMTYNPVLLQNSKTGEMLTEEELAKKKEEQKKAGKEDDWRARRDRNLRIDLDRKSERKEKERLAIEDGRNGEISRDRNRYEKSKRHNHSPEDQRKRDRSRSKERRKRDSSRDSERRRIDRDRDVVEPRYGSSHKHLRSRESSHHHSSSRRGRSRSAEHSYRR